MMTSEVKHLHPHPGHLAFTKCLFCDLACRRLIYSFIRTDMCTSSILTLCPGVAAVFPVCAFAFSLYSIL